MLLLCNHSSHLHLYMYFLFSFISLDILTLDGQVESLVACPSLPCTLVCGSVFVSDIP